MDGFLLRAVQGHPGAERLIRAPWITPRAGGPEPARGPPEEDDHDEGAKSDEEQ